MFVSVRFLIILLVSFFVTSWYLRVCCILMSHLRHSLKVEVDVVGIYVGCLIISITSTSPFVVFLFLGGVLFPYLLEFGGFDGCTGISWRWGLLGGVGVLFLFLDSYPLFGVLVIGRVYFFFHLPPSLLISLRKFFLYQHSAVLWPRLSHIQHHLDILIVLFVHLWFSDLIWIVAPFC